MRWEYFGTGLALVGIGVTLMVALPPPWWPKMPIPLVHIGVIVGGVLTFVGVVLAIFGAWPVLPSPKIAVLGMGFSTALLIGFAIWFWAIPNMISIENPAVKPLKRLIAYQTYNLDVPWKDNAAWLHGILFRVNNVSDDTITAHVEFIKIKIDDNKVALEALRGAPVIVPQTQGVNFQAFFTGGEEDKPILLDAKNIVVEFEVDYDTIPETGVRKSYKEITFPINWANGQQNRPLLEPRITAEWEK